MQSEHWTAEVCARKRLNIWQSEPRGVSTRIGWERSATRKKRSVCRVHWLESWAYNRCEIKVSLLQLGLLWWLHVWTVKCQLRHQSLFQFINTCWYCLNVGFGVVRSKAALSSSDANYPFTYWFSCHLSTVFLYRPLRPPLLWGSWGTFRPARRHSLSEVSWHFTGT